MGRTLSVMGRQRWIRLLAVTAIAVAGLVAPATVSAHPLGNFTINHYAGLTVAADHLSLDVVIDMAEIPTFQERQTMDVDEDGSVADEEAAAWATTTCRDLAGKLRVTRDAGAPLPLESDGSATATFLPGAGGLSTLRLECGYRAPLAPMLGSSSTSIGFVDGSYAERIGWREIVAGADGTILDTHGLPATSPSQKLTSYPADKIATPLDIRSATIAARLDPAAVVSVMPAGSTTSPAGAAPVAAAAGAVPGGVAGELPDIFRTADLTPFVVLASLAVAAWIGA